jgi:hypothetical protein
MSVTTSASFLTSIGSVQSARTVSDISTVNDGLISQEKTIFEAIAVNTMVIVDITLHAIFTFFNPEVKGTETSEVNLQDVEINKKWFEFKLLYAKARELYKNTEETLITNEARIDDLDKFLGEIDKFDFGNFERLATEIIGIAHHSKILQNTLIPTETLAQIQTQIFNITDLDPKQKQQAISELTYEKLMQKLNKIKRASILFSNLKRRIRVKKLLLPKTSQQQQPDAAIPKIKLMELATMADSALLRFVDGKDKLPLTINDADDEYNQQLQYQIDELQELRKAIQSISSNIPEIKLPQTINSKKRTNENPTGEVSVDEQLTQTDPPLSDKNILDLNTERSELVNDLVKTVKEIDPTILPEAPQVGDQTNLPHTPVTLTISPQVLPPSPPPPFQEPEPEINSLLREILTTIQNRENPTAKRAKYDGGKPKRFLQRISKVSTRRRKYRVKTVKPKKRGNKRMTKSNRKKRQTKKR